VSQASVSEQGYEHAPERPLIVRIVHASPGRIRAKVPREAFDSPQLRQAEDALLAVDGVQSVKRKPAASSVLVSYDPAVTTVPALFAALADRNVTIVAPDDEPERSPGRGGSRSTVARWLATPFQQSDRKLGEATDHTIDVRTLLPIGLAALAAREVLSGRAHMAPWYTLAWWAFDSYLKLQRPEVVARVPKE
jgi:copper chaperone CopZ